MPLYLHSFGKAESQKQDHLAEAESNTTLICFLGSMHIKNNELFSFG
jgi:hypothetical protein